MSPLFGLPLGADLVPEITITADGVYWHPIGAEDADLLVTPEIFPLADAFAAARRAFEHEEAHLPVEVVLFCSRATRMQVAALLAELTDSMPRIDIAWNTNLAYLQANSWSDHRCQPIAMRDNPVHRAVLDAEGLHHWVEPHLDGYTSLRDACVLQGFFASPAAKSAAE